MAHYTNLWSHNMREPQTTCRFKYHWKTVAKKSSTYCASNEKLIIIFLSNDIPIGWFCWVTISCCSTHLCSKAFTIKCRTHLHEWLTLSEHTWSYFIVCTTPFLNNVFYNNQSNLPAVHNSSVLMKAKKEHSFVWLNVKQVNFFQSRLWKKNNQTLHIPAP